MFAMASALGARSLNVVDIFGGTWSLDAAAGAFAALCRRAASHGLLVHLEFLPWSRIPDLATAWTIVRDADEPNGGITIDAWHYFRSGSDSGLLGTIPGERILGVQLNDAPLAAEPDLTHATLHERRLPGEGEFDLHSLIDTLRRIGSPAPFGVEVFSDGLLELPATEVAIRAGDALRALLA
jgi:sugar phosphate isomerase/epimerase